MKSKAKLVLASVLTFITALAPLASAPVLAANDNPVVCKKDSNGKYLYSEDIRIAAGCSEESAATQQTVDNVITKIISGVILSLGIVCVAFIVYGGVSYMASAGDPGKLQKAKHTIIYACVGLIICVLAFAIVNFAIGLIGNGSSTSTE